MKLDTANPPKHTGKLLARNTALNFLGQLVPLFIGAVTIPFVIHRLGIDSFGVLSLAWIVLGYFSFFDLGLGLTTTKFMAEALGKNDTKILPRLFWNTFSIQALMGILAALVLALVTPILVTRVFNIPGNLVIQTERIFYLLAFSVPFVMLSESLCGSLQAAQRFDLVNAVKIPTSAAVFIIPALGIIAGMNLLSIIGGIIVARIIAFLAYLAFCFKIFPAIRRYVPIQSKQIRSLLVFGGWVSVSKIVSPILNYFERFFIVSLLSVGMLTFYTAPFEMVSRIVIIPASIAVTIFPAFSYYGKNNSALVNELFSRSLKYLLLAMTLVGVIILVFAENILGWWIGKEFAGSSSSLLRILTGAFLVNAFAFVPLAALQGFGRPDLKAKLDLALTPVFIGLLYFLIRGSGIHGAAWAKFITAIIDTLCLFIFAQKMDGLSVTRLMSQALGRGVLISAAFAATAWIAFNYTAFPPRLILIAVFCVIYIFSYWNFALDTKERGLITNLHRNLLCR